jgi:hypothetical protein
MKALSDDGEILVAVVDKTIYVKPFGYATQQNALGLPDFISAMFREGCKSVTLDLAECEGMDSTFFGVIAAAAMSPNSGRGEHGKGVLIINADAEAREQLGRIGLLPVVSIKEAPCDSPPDLQLSEIDFVHLPKTEEERLRKIKQLHEELVKLNERNRRNFGSFIEMLDKELESD